VFIKSYFIRGLTLLLFACSLLAVLPAPNVYFWFLAIGATEYGHWAAFGSLFLSLWIVCPSLRDSAALCRKDRCFLCINLAATALFVSPSVRAWKYSQDLADAALSTFAAGSSPSTPLQLSKLWLGTTPQRIPEEILPYTEDGARHLLFTRSPSKTRVPCIVILHTGGWNSGTPAEFRAMNCLLAERGFSTAALEYRLAPTWKWPAQRDDVAAAIHYLRTHSEQLGIDAAQFVLLGRSAGGQIAQAYAYGVMDPSIRGVIAFYAPADLLFAHKYARSDDVLNSLKLLREYLGGDPGEQPETYESSSGLLLAKPDSPPTLLLHGSRDELVWVLQSRRLHAQLQKIGVPSQFLEFSWATHAFDFNPNGPGGQISTWAVERFLRSVTH
jgi:acetyl esterase/lipase